MGGKKTIFDYCVTIVGIMNMQDDKEKKEQDCPDDDGFDENINDLRSNEEKPTYTKDDAKSQELVKKITRTS